MVHHEYVHGPQRIRSGRRARPPTRRRTADGGIPGPSAAARRRLAGMTAVTPELGEVARSDAALRAFLHGLPGVDQVGAEQRAAMLGTRSIKTTAKAWALELAIRMVDLTTLEGADTPGKVRALCAKARRPDPGDASCPAVAAVCVYPAMVD